MSASHFAREVAVFLGISFFAAPAPAEERQVVLDPREGVALERTLAPEETHAYRLELAEGFFLHLEVDQRGIDVETALFAPGGKKMLASDRAIFYEGPEDLLLVTPRPGIYRLEVSGFPARRPAGKYEVRLVAYRPASADDRARAEAARLLFVGEDEAGEQAVESYRRALALWQQTGDLFRQGETLFLTGQIHEDELGARDEARGFYGRAAELFREAGNGRFEAIAVSYLGMALLPEEPDRAAAEFRRALTLSRAAKDRLHAGILSTNLGRIYWQRGELRKAQDIYRDALGLLSETHDLDPRARLLQNLGVLYRQLGDFGRARDHLEASEQAFAALGAHRLQAFPLNQIGQLQQDQGDLEGALATYRRVLDLRRRAGDLRGVAVTLGKVGRVKQELGELVAAAEHYRQALAILEDGKELLDRARVLLYQGSLLERLDRPHEALEVLRRSFGLFERLRELEGQAESLMAIARAERRRGDRRAALSAVSAALEIFEAVRPRPIAQDLRISFFATVHHHYDFYVDLLMDLHRSAPAAGHDGAALEASERARARALLDLLAEVGPDLRRGIAPDLLARQRKIQSLLNHREGQRMRLLEKGAAAERTRPIESEVRRLITELESLRGEMRRQGTVAEPRPLRLAEIQRQLDEDSLLLEYALGEERSFLWAMTRDALESFELPGQNEIEGKVSAALRALSRSRRPDARLAARSALCALGESLLEPVGAMLEERRLLIVADTTLSYLPFAALPKPGFQGPCAEAPPLVSDHPITYLPSASALAVLRRQIAAKERPSGLLAVVADPVFTVADERLQERVGAASAVAGRAFFDYDRLRYSAREAEALLSLVPAGRRSFSASGFDATKEVATSGRLSEYRLVHFATHATLHSHPELSGLAFSLFDEEGRPVDGFLRAHEIYNLDLPADLVVLSACRTALGEEVKGEGIVGLTRAFHSAGAARVMVSLWNVSDLSTAELMTRFYRFLLADALSPAEALRQAQLSMWRERPWSAPYHWAGFVIQGEPR